MFPRPKSPEEERRTSMAKFLGATTERKEIRDKLERLLRGRSKKLEFLRRNLSGEQIEKLIRVVKDSIGGSLLDLDNTANRKKPKPYGSKRKSRSNSN